MNTLWFQLTTQPSRNKEWKDSSRERDWSQVGSAQLRVYLSKRSL